VQLALLEAFQAVVAKQLPGVAFWKAQLWGAALPLNTPGVPFVYDSQARVGICGDWLTGASMQSAAVSGAQLAGHIHKLCSSQHEIMEHSDEWDMGLAARAEWLQSSSIGEFPARELLAA
jgi:hypothetical protein